MFDILSRAGCFVCIIIIGYVLKRVGFFKESDFKILSKIVLKITLPASIIFNFAGMVIEPSILVLAAFGLGGGVIYMLIGWLINKRRGKEAQAFAMVNTAGYNIGNFTMPFVQSFLGPIGVITTSLFDSGNAFVCLGGSYALASSVKDGKGFSFKKILKALITSLPFDCYIIMTILSLAHLTLPQPIITFASIIGNANAFLAMFMIGIGFNLSGNKEQAGDIFRVLSVRYGVAIVLALVFYFLLPFDLEVRRALMILVFSPIASASPAFTGDLKGDVGLASAVNSMSIIISILCIVGILLITG